jgi:transcriptional regulator with XRE-family HTH domain
MTIETDNIGKFLKKLREDRQLTQQELADKVGKHRSYIARIEGSEGSNMKMQTFLEIVKVGFDGVVNIEFNYE